jgi:hypothetical protein
MGMQVLLCRLSASVPQQLVRSWHNRPCRDALGCTLPKTLVLLQATFSCTGRAWLLLTLQSSSACGT